MTHINARLARLTAYADSFAGAFRRRDQARWIRVYLEGLLSPGARKTIETIARSVSPPPGLAVEDLAQALQNFVNQSPWDENELWRRYRARVAPRCPDQGILVIDDVGFAKQGQRSVGVQRQYWSERGKKVNCQLAVTLSWAGPTGVCPLALRLYLPRNWLNDTHRLETSGVPPEHRAGRGKGRIALDLIDELRAEGWPVRIVLAPSGYGAVQEFREGLAERRLGYLIGVSGDVSVLPRPGVPPVSVAEWSRRSSAPGRLAWDRVWPGPDWPGSEALGLLREETPQGEAQYALADLPPEFSGREVVDLWRRRRSVADLYQVLRDELGLDHFEGRSWRGFHHHACLVMLAYGFHWAEEERSALDNVQEMSSCG